MKIRPQTRDIFYITDVPAARIGRGWARERKASGLKTRATLHLSAARELCTARRFRPLCAAFARRRPAIFFVIDASSGNFDAFAFEEPPLKRSKRFADDQLSACADDAMPWNAAAARRARHCVADHARASAHFERASDFAVRGYAAARYSLHESIDGFPGHDFSQSRRARHASKLVGNSCALAQLTENILRLALPPRFSRRLHDSCNH
jgi:hypothetical protein